ncbi:SRPBCC domain-containing protein [Kitasatospora cinereorecta]|uniref:SRPBCC domain-containing protein n=1 Tax=Kitasatospora cinereorecta TaxID=285560 RepID=A0ABW0VMK8_9ACTN
MDTTEEIAAIHREVGTREVGGERARRVLLRRAYDASAERVWAAVTDPERIGRWFLPVGGDLRQGGHYQLEGNAGGGILRCVAPSLLRIGWVMGDAAAFSEVELRLTRQGAERTVFELDHVAVVPPAMWEQYGPGAVGVGWDLTLLGLGLFLAGRPVAPAEAAAWQDTDEARDFITRSSAAWGAAHLAAGAGPEAAAASVAATTAFYAPPRPV